MRAAHAIYTRKAAKEESKQEREATQSQAVDGLEAEPIITDETVDQRADNKGIRAALVRGDIPFIASIGSLPLLELELNQTSYNALASVIKCTQTKENFFNVFLFKGVLSSA